MLTQCMGTVIGSDDITYLCKKFCSWIYDIVFVFMYVYRVWLNSCIAFHLKIRASAIYIECLYLSAVI